MLAGREYQGSPSIGISLFRDQQQTVDELLMRADTAMYRSKAAGRNTLRFFDPAMQEALHVRTALSSELRYALPRRQLQLYYQPQMDNARRVCGAEALLRWQRPDGEMILPADFIPLAEENGHIVPIGLWVLETACAQLKTWEQLPATRELRLAINASAHQFRQADFVEQVRTVLERTGANPARLQIELTEGLVLDNVADTIEKMLALRKLGVGFAMDDFGIGYSSLSYLKRLPLDQLKIDKSFILDLTTDPHDAVIVQTIIGMAKNLGLNVVAEGVETEAQLEFLGQHGCTAYQGYLFSPPVPLAQFEQLLK